MKNILIFINQCLFAQRDYGLLLFRLGVGCMFMWHGFPKISGGEEKWLELGKSMGTLGIHFAPAFWGFMPGLIEFGGGLFFALGLFYRPAAFLLFSNMGIAFISQMLEGKGLMKAAQSFEDGFSFLGAVFVGPGKYSLDYYLGLISSTTKNQSFESIN